MEQRVENRTFWQIYTLPNIWNEIKLRLSAMSTQRNASPTRSRTAPAYDGKHAREVGQFYDVHYDDFQQVYGEVIQAFRTRNIADLLNYQINSIGFRPGQRALDAGCGNGVPAIHFAQQAQVQVDAITISKRQYEMARSKIALGNLADRITVVLGDFHELTKHFSSQSYDVVYFLESFGHSRAKRRVIDQCWDVLKPGGILFIKDLFRRIPVERAHKRRIERELRRINEAYRYDVADLTAVLNDIRGKGFILTSLKTIDLSLEQFENLAISNRFQELTGLARIDNWADYVFPVEFFELKCVKPEYSLEERVDRYFLQHRYHNAIEKSGEPRTPDS